EGAVPELRALREVEAAAQQHAGSVDETVDTGSAGAQRRRECQALLAGGDNQAVDLSAGAAGRVEGFTATVLVQVGQHQFGTCLSHADRYGPAVALTRPGYQSPFAAEQPLWNHDALLPWPPAAASNSFWRNSRLMILPL